MIVTVRSHYDYDRVYVHKQWLNAFKKMFVYTSELYIFVKLVQYLFIIY